MSFNRKNDQRVAAHLFCLFIEKLSTVFRLFTPQNSRLVTSFNRKMISASRRIFSAFISKNSLQYFDCLPLKMIVLWCHPIGKMISASRRIFSVFISKTSLQYFDRLPIRMTILWRHSIGKWSARRGASFLSLYRKALYSISIVYISKWSSCDVIQ